MGYLVNITGTLLSSMEVSWRLEAGATCHVVRSLEDQAEFSSEISDLAECLPSVN